MRSQNRPASFADLSPSMWGGFCMCSVSNTAHLPQNGYLSNKNPLFEGLKSTAHLSQNETNQTK